MDSISSLKDTLFYDIEVCQQAINEFRKRARTYYFDVVLSLYRCPNCGSRFQLNKHAQAACTCGWLADPTIEFQFSDCCRSKLLRKRLHYICSKCRKIVPSIFLFDERLYDREYFVEKMRMLRERRCWERFEKAQMLLIGRSNSLSLTDEVALDAISNLCEDLNQLLGYPKGQETYDREDRTQSFNQYRDHILGLLTDEILFSSISPIESDDRADRVYRFITLIFMEHEREVNLFPYGNDILVRKNETVRKRQRVPGKTEGSL
jgi:DNA-directed RNA polymerase subunit RPC12/RpoP